MVRFIIYNQKIRPGNESPPLLYHPGSAPHTADLSLEEKRALKNVARSREPILSSLGLENGWRTTGPRKWPVWHVIKRAVHPLQDILSLIQYEKKV
jgi:hypothetical protein